MEPQKTKRKVVIKIKQYFFNRGGLRLARKNKRMSLTEAAAKLGISASTLSRWEDGETPITVENLFYILGVYGASLSDVFVVKDNMEDY